VSVDITERKQLEREREVRAAELDMALRKRTQEARRAELAEQSLREADRRKDDFLATLAHELRNPLAPLRNALELLKSADDDTTLIEEARCVMERQVNQMIRLVDDLLDVSRITKGKLQVRKKRVELAEVLSLAIETARPLIERSAHELIVTIPTGPVYVQADPTRLAQVIVNLLNNSAKFTDNGGRIWLTAGRRGQEAVIAVRDTGIGIEPDYVPHLFTKFSQATPALERSHGGLGIGLSLVKGLVELHAGTIEVHSDGLGQGSQFTIYLPILDLPVEALREASADDGKTAGARKCRILVVDDFRDATDSLARMLRVMGHDCETAYDGLEALQVAVAFRPDVVLLDIGLPKLDGYQTAQRIRHEPWGGSIALVALTGWGQDEDKRRAAEAGFDHHLTKPVDPADLQRVLAGLVRRTQVSSL
jgi:signal transduction histidine kinase/ActR/RegA family two-component response regulator